MSLLNQQKLFQNLSIILLILVIIFQLIDSAIAASGCGNSFYGPRGAISSPYYPRYYPNNTSCTWTIKGQPGDVITVSFADLDIEAKANSDCKDGRCCPFGWLKIGTNDPSQTVQYCGTDWLPEPFFSNSSEVWVKFHSRASKRRSRGFRLSFITGPAVSGRCNRDEFHCLNRKCIIQSWQCNGFSECGDNSDELKCGDVCKGMQQPCGSVAQGCFIPHLHHCNGQWDCENGRDEMGCGNCDQNKIPCRGGSGCFSELERCNRVAQCPDLSDEINCEFCGNNRTWCGLYTRQCYDPIKEKCDGYANCPNAQDEIGCVPGCEGRILCSSGTGCYNPDNRCDGMAQCTDSSDELGCISEMCKSERGGFLCNNARCIRENWRCDQSDDCGDNSDEMNCVKNSVVTAAVMGSLICGLLLVIAVGCSYKLYTLRIGDQHDDMETPLSPLEEEFMHREPPPPYAVAVGAGDAASNYYFQRSRSLSMRDPVYSGSGSGSSRRSSSSRRTRRGRRRAPSPPPPIPPPPSGSHSSEPGTSGAHLMVAPPSYRESVKHYGSRKSILPPPCGVHNGNSSSATNCPSTTNCPATNFPSATNRPSIDFSSTTNFSLVATNFPSSPPDYDDDDVSPLSLDDSSVSRTTASSRSDSPMIEIIPSSSNLGDESSESIINLS